MGWALRASSDSTDLLAIPSTDYLCGLTKTLQNGRWLHENAPSLLDMANRTLEQKLDSQDFYELCQQYRWARLDAAAEYAAIRAFLLRDELPWPSYDTEDAVHS